MSILDELPSNLFSHQAGPDQARLRLTPEESEEQVGAYLGRLRKAIDHPGYVGGSGVHSLVFGEYGHGKTQVFYRTADCIRSHSNTLTLPIVTSAPLPGPIIEAARRELPAGLQGGSHLDQTACDLAGMRSDDPETARRAAVALAGLASVNGRDHAVLLFDEAQTVIDLFEVFLAFLRELRQAFKQARVNLHTMQCHSLASMPKARELRTKLSDWLGDAVVLHLSSVLQSDAFSFFYRRALDCGLGARQAEELVPDGVARTLCEAAGGNPRLMLIYADSVLAYAKATGASRLGGEHVRAVFARTRGIRGGNLFVEPHLERTRDLAVEELRPDRAQVMVLALGLTDRFFGEYWRADESELVNRFSIEAHRLPALLDVVDGRRVFACEQDCELELNQYYFTPEFRTYLSGGFGSSGGFDVRQAQYGLLMEPDRWQKSVVDGLAQVLRQQGRTVGLPQLQSLGAFPSGHPIRAYHFETTVSGMSERIRVLVTAFYGTQPPADALRQIRDGLAQRKWLRAIVLFASEEHFWDQLATQEELTQVLDQPEGDPACFRALQREDWGELVRPFAGVEELPPMVEAAIVFANLVDLGKRYQSQQKLGGELQGFQQGIIELFDAAIPKSEELCYLPTAEERDLLDNKVWLNHPGGVTKKRLGEALGQRMEGTSLDNLRPTLVTIQKGGFVRCPAVKYPLYAAMHNLLRENAGRSLTFDELSNEASRRVLLVGPSSRRRDVVEWVAKDLEKDGLADLSSNTVRFIDLEKDVSLARKRVRELTAKIKDVMSRFAVLDDAAVERYQSRYDTLSELPSQGLSLREQRDQLTGIEGDLESLKIDLDAAKGGIEKERDDLLDDLRKKLGELETQRAVLPDAFRLLLASEEDFTEVRDDVDEALKKAQSRAAMSMRHLETTYSELEQRLHQLRVALSGQERSELWEQLCRTLVDRQQRPFRELVVTVKE